MEKKKKPKVVVASPCCGCPEMDSFSFEGCMRNCRRFLNNLAKVASGKGSPCLEFRCGVPGVNNRNKLLCEVCPIRKAYADSFGKEKKEARCVLGIKDPNPYLSKRELKEREFYKR
jgi:hypothetical protein